MGTDFFYPDSMKEKILARYDHNEEVAQSFEKGNVVAYRMLYDEALTAFRPEEVLSALQGGAAAKANLLKRAEMQVEAKALLDELVQLNADAGVDVKRDVSDIKSRWLSPGEFHIKPIAIVDAFEDASKLEALQRRAENLLERQAERQASHIEFRNSEALGLFDIRPEGEGYKLTLKHPEAWNKDTHMGLVEDALTAGGVKFTTDEAHGTITVASVPPDAKIRELITKKVQATALGQ